MIKYPTLSFIPDCYKYNSERSELELLAGLLDTDGSVHDSGRPNFILLSKQLFLDVCWIARSLGYNATYWTRSPKYIYTKGKGKRGSYAIQFTFTQMTFYLSYQERTAFVERGGQNLIVE